jgi:hypothetical protein
VKGEGKIAGAMLSLSLADTPRVRFMSKEWCDLTPALYVSTPGFSFCKIV